MPDDVEYIIAHCDQCRHNQATRMILFGKCIKTTKCKFCGKKIPVNKENAKIYGDMELARVVQELNMKEFQEDIPRWKGCGHPVKAVILDNNPLSVAIMLEFEENNPKELCLDCWEKENKI